MIVKYAKLVNFLTHHANYSNTFMFFYGKFFGGKTELFFFCRWCLFFSSFSPALYHLRQSQIICIKTWPCWILEILAVKVYKIKTNIFPSSSSFVYCRIKTHTKSTVEPKAKLAYRRSTGRITMREFCALWNIQRWRYDWMHPCCWMCNVSKFLFDYIKIVKNMIYSTVEYN